MKTKFLVSNKFLSFLILIITFTFTCSVRAEYYQAYDGCQECNNVVVYKKVVHHYPVRHHSCPHKVYHKVNKHKYTHHKSHRRTHYEIAVYYNTVPCCNPCADRCGYQRVQVQCQREVRGCLQHWSRSYVEFSGMPTSYRDALYYTNDETESSRYIDRGSMDDDANYYPDMNINN